MPTYDYYCEACGEELEAVQKITEDALRQCPKCHKETLMRRPRGGIGLAFSGDGFYKTMYGQRQGESAPPSAGKNGQCCPCGKSQGSCKASE